MTAPTLRNLVNSNGVNSVVMGHSLGNMVVSEALLKGANASTYIMLDAAVASEAYRPGLQADSLEVVDKYRPSDWEGYDTQAWAANWYTWFTNTQGDARAKLGWAGHFAPLLNRQGLDVYNFYSSGDEVSAHYGKIYGRWGIWGGTRARMMFFNMTPNDTNLEDMKTFKESELRERR